MPVWVMSDHAPTERLKRSLKDLTKPNIECSWRVRGAWWLGWKSKNTLNYWTPRVNVITFCKYQFMHMCVLRYRIWQSCSYETNMFWQSYGTIIASHYHHHRTKYH
jgi:hypothetical protein